MLLCSVMFSSSNAHFQVHRFSACGRRRNKSKLTGIRSTTCSCRCGCYGKLWPEAFCGNFNSRLHASLDNWGVWNLVKCQKRQIILSPLVVAFDCCFQVKTEQNSIWIFPQSWLLNLDLFLCCHLISNQDKRLKFPGTFLKQPICVALCFVASTAFCVFAERFQVWKTPFTDH